MAARWQPSEQGLSSAAGFTSIEISDSKPKLLSAAEARLTALGAPVRTAQGPAISALKEIMQRIDRHGLHLAFLDPHSLGALSFSLFEELAKLRHVDVIVHVSTSDLQRNTGIYTAKDRKEFDAFAPDWRVHVGEDMNQQALRGEIIKYWSKKVEALGLPRAPHCELIRGTKEQRLYWLIFLR